MVLRPLKFLNTLNSKFYHVFTDFKLTDLKKKKMFKMWKILKQFLVFEYIKHIARNIPELTKNLVTNMYIIRSMSWLLYCYDKRLFIVSSGELSITFNTLNHRDMKIWSELLPFVLASAIVQQVWIYHFKYFVNNLE